MKKGILLICLCLFTLPPLLRAQCTPDQNIGNALMHPETLADAMAGYYYSQVLTFRVPSDTDIVYNGNKINAIIDSMKMIAILGIPSGFSYACAPASCTWNGGTLGCALIQGTADKNDTSLIKEFPIKMYIYTWARIAGSIPYTRLDSSERYIFKVRAYNNTAEVNPYTPLTVYPNPSEGKFTIELHGTSGRVWVTDMAGKTVFDKEITDETNFLNTVPVDLGSNAAGLYQVMLQSGTTLSRQKISIN